ncbi:PucR family transcriptional regulator [Streptacidiphilus sp. P02-A3a]|uniref:PucR family transcriptional regulator n=1 Tax=Streptacidiphilus sp. P02-A3a TaxID=2704468 RepID=UPI0015FCE4AA|nr:PucR family transcriptional regulator [Streptacidiphilus sp. P02-A3a]QMU68435.1 PucR family transcriptional regulator [Streptacidiphilus sp. P02-A3a]
MIVGDLLRLEDLHLGLAWGTADLLERPVSGVTSTDLQDPARYLQPGELVLSGLVWWKPESGAEREPDAALRFATSLRSARVAALLAGEGTHGRVPPSLVDACRTHGIPLISIPAGTSFRAVTDRIYLRLWGELSTGSARAGALPEAVRQELAALLDTGAPLDRVLALAVARLGLPPCAIVSATGRPVAGSAAAGDGGARPPAAEGGVPVGPPEASPFAGWRLTGATTAAARALADLLAPRALAARSEDSARRRAAADLFDLLAAPGTADHGDVVHALGGCSLPAEAPLTTLSARIERAPAGWAVEALTELLRLAGARFAVGSDERGEAAAVVAGQVGDLRPLLPALQALLGPGRQLRIGVGPAAAATAAGLRGSLVGARYALASAAPYADAARLDSLASLLAGIPAEVTAAFHERLLGRLVSNDRENGVSLVDTLAAFLAHDGSWARTAKALHVHVNTVHYRVRRIEELTGRSLVRLADQADLRTALLCAPRGGAA